VKGALQLISVFQRTLLKCYNANCSDIIGRMYINPEDDITSHIAMLHSRVDKDLSNRGKLASKLKTVSSR